MSRSQAPSLLRLAPSCAPGWLVVLLLALTTGAVLRAEPVVSASIYPATVRPGGTATLTITVADGRPSNVDKPPQLPEGMELVNPTAEYGETPVTLRGTEQMAMTMSWRVTCPEAGTYIIPPQEILIRGDTFRTKMVRLEVKEDPNASTELDPILSIKTEKQEVYEGEVVPLTATLYIHSRTLLRRPGLIELPKDNFAVQRFPLQPDEESIVRFGSVPYRANAFYSTVSGLKPGKYTLGPATCEVFVEIPIGDENSRFLYAQTETRKVKVRSADVSINIIPLPKEGRPGTFSGAVGDFSIGLTAEPLEVNVGDPISVEMTITGTGNFDSVNVPVLTDPKAWKTYPARKFQPSEMGYTPRSRNQRVTFSQIILPNQVVKEIPSFEFSFFNPEKKQYEVRRTQAVPLKVKGAPLPKTPEAPSPANTIQAAPDRSQEPVPMPKPAITDILTNTSPRATWVATTIPILRDRRFVIANYIAGALLLLLIAGKLIVTAVRHHALSPEAPARHAWKELQRTRTRGDFYTQAMHYATLKGLHPTQGLAALQQRQEALNYARHPNEAAQPVPRDERQSVMNILRGEPATLPPLETHVGSPSPVAAAPQSVTLASELSESPAQAAQDGSEPKEGTHS